MLDDSLYLTSHDTALAVVATAMKKARLPLDTLLVNSFMGGVLFSMGGMLYVMVESYFPEELSKNPGVIYLIQGLVYPIGLFYVVVLGVDLFNSNVLFFSTAFFRGAVHIVDLLISWIVSYWMNLVGNIFVCYILMHYSGITQTEQIKSGSIRMLENKLLNRFHHTLLRGVTGNFLVCLGIYLQIMVKPAHVKFLMLVLPIFCLVANSFTHAVADMYLIIIALINGAPYSVAHVAWKLMLPAAIGNIVGGIFFSLTVPFYLHMYLVERDGRRLNLPQYLLRDEQPDLNLDSRVVRVPYKDEHDEEEDEQERREKLENEDRTSLSSESNVHPVPSVQPLQRTTTGNSMSTARLVRSRRLVRSPSFVFPVYGMAAPLRREVKIAQGVRGDDNEEENNEDEEQPYLSSLLRKTFSRRLSKQRDLESRSRRLSTSSNKHWLTLQRRGSGHVTDFHIKASRARVTPAAANAANETAGVPDYLHMVREGLPAAAHREREREKP